MSSRASKACKQGLESFRKRHAMSVASEERSSFYNISGSTRFETNKGGESRSSIKNLLLNR